MPGYIAGLVDYQSVLQVIDTETTRFCLPSNVKLKELRPVVLDQLGAKSPDELRAVALSS
ncbi:MAG: Rap1a/Tai family immunity protein [Pseudomonadota bacterium]